MSLAAVALCVLAAAAPPVSSRPGVGSAAPVSAGTAAPTEDPPIVDATVRHAGGSFRVITIDPSRVDLDLLGQVRAPEARTFEALDAWLTAQGRELVVATNAGIYAPGERPLGLHIERGEEVVALNTADGAGNFFLKPGGVFWIDGSGAHVAATDEVKASPPPLKQTRLATQSGPLLLSGGKVHPAFRPRSKNRALRSGVGVDSAGRVVIAISVGRVRFHDFATLFRDKLGCADALYLDGAISALRMAGEPLAAPYRYAGFLVVSRPVSAPPAKKTTKPTLKPKSKSKSRQ